MEQMQYAELALASQWHREVAWTCCSDLAKRFAFLEQEDIKINMQVEFFTVKILFYLFGNIILHLNVYSFTDISLTFFRDAYIENLRALLFERFCS